jgi:O-antigen ligase
MAFYKGLFAWLIISVAIGWGCWRTIAPEGKGSFVPILVVTVVFIVLVAVTGCKVDEEEHGEHDHSAH